MSPTTDLLGREVGEFSVFWWDPDGNVHAEVRFVDIKTACQTVKSLSHRPAVNLGIIRGISITNGNHQTCFLWKREAGITYPPEEAAA